MSSKDGFPPILHIRYPSHYCNLLSNSTRTARTTNIHTSTPIPKLPLGWNFPNGIRASTNMNAAMLNKMSMTLLNTLSSVYLLKKPSHAKEVLQLRGHQYLDRWLGWLELGIGLRRIVDRLSHDVDRIFIKWRKEKPSKEPMTIPKMTLSRRIRTISKWEHKKRLTKLSDQKPIPHRISHTR